MSSHIFDIPHFEIEGKTYTFTRLNARATQNLSGLIKTAWKNGVLDLNIHLEQMKFMSPNPDDFKVDITGELMAFFSVDHCLDQFLELMTLYLVEVMEDKSKRLVKEEELEDADLFPMYSLVTLAAYFTAHPDLSMFVSALNEGKDLPFFQTVLRKLRNMSVPNPT